jgi:hypothetical protein
MKPIEFFQEKFIQLKMEVLSCRTIKELELFEEHLIEYIEELDKSEFKDILDESAEDFGRLLEMIYLIKKESSEN